MSAVKSGLWCLFAVLLGTSACTSYSTRLSPRPVPRGSTEISFAADIQVAQGRADQKTLPVLEASIRYGLSSRVDIGGKVNFLGGELNTKIALVRSDAFAVAVVPGVGMQTLSEVADDDNLFAATFSLPVLAGVRLGESAEVILGSKLITQVPAGTSTSNTNLGRGALTILPGGVLGCRLILTEGFALFPELNVHFPYTVELKRWREPVFQGGLGFHFLL